MHKVMIVDDESAVLRGLSDMVDWQSLDLELVACATSGQEALSFLKLAPVQILITDICMPQMDGLMLIASAKALNPALRCIIISAHDEFDYVRQALTLGVENYLLKPINSSELTETLTKTIENIERDLAREPVEVLAFRTNILDRWMNSSIQDYELAERAALLKINMRSRGYQVILLTPFMTTTISDRLAFFADHFDQIQKTLSGLIDSEIFLDRYANVAIMLHSDHLRQNRQEIVKHLMMALSVGKCYASGGNIVENAYDLGTSYRNAYAMLAYRYLDPGTYVFFDDFPVVNEASFPLLSFEQALDALNEQEAENIIREVWHGNHEHVKDIKVHPLLPYLLKLLTFIDRSASRGSPLPDRFLHDLQALPQTNHDDQLGSLIQIMRNMVHAQKDFQNTFTPIVRRALDIIAVNYDKNINLKTISEQLNINPSYFGQLFRSETGQHFVDYLTSLRMRAACNYLTNTDLKIGEIIASIGIAQQSYFNRLFKKEYGVTPLEYRRAVLPRRG